MSSAVDSSSKRARSDEGVGGAAPLRADPVADQLPGIERWIEGPCKKAAVQPGVTNLESTPDTLADLPTLPHASTSLPTAHESRKAAVAIGEMSCQAGAFQAAQPPHSSATAHELLINSWLPQTTISILSQQLMGQPPTATTSLPQQLQHALGDQPSTLAHDMPAPWQALVQQVKDVQQRSQSLPTLSDLSGLGLPSITPSNLMATTLDAVFRMSGTHTAMQSLSTLSLSRLAASSLAGSGDGAPPQLYPAAAAAPRLSRLHLKEERLILQAIGIHRAAGKQVPDALVRAQELMSKSGHLPPDTVIPPATAEGAVDATRACDDTTGVQPEVVGPRASRKSRYRGVEWDRSVGKWRARITHQGKKLSLGSHVNERDAARVYNEHALRLKGNNAHLNEVASEDEDDEQPTQHEPMMQGKSGFRGVTWDRRENRWRARITYQGKHKAIGRYSTEYSAALAYDKMAIVLLGERARTNYDRAAVAQLLQELVPDPADAEGSGDGAAGWEANSEDAPLRVNGSKAAPSDQNRPQPPSTEPSLVEAANTHQERNDQLGSFMHNMLLMGTRSEPPMDNLMQQLGQQVPSSLALGMLQQQPGMVWPPGSQPLPDTFLQPHFVELQKALMSQLQQGQERVVMGIPSTTVSSGPAGQPGPA